jgi:hypothetical protein
MPFTLYLNHPHRSGTFHYATCWYATNRKADDTDNGIWLDHLKSEFQARGLLINLCERGMMCSAYRFR